MTVCSVYERIMTALTQSYVSQLAQVSAAALKPTIRQLLASSRTDTVFENKSVQVNGWVKSIRHQKRVAFAVLQDGTSADTLQAVFLNPAMAAPYASESCVPS